MKSNESVCFYEGFCLLLKNSRRIQVTYVNIIPYAGMPHGGIKVLGVRCPQGDSCPYINDCKIDEEAEDYLSHFDSSQSF